MGYFDLDPHCSHLFDQQAMTHRVEGFREVKVYDIYELSLVSHACDKLFGYNKVGKTRTSRHESMLSVTYLRYPRQTVECFDAKRQKVVCQT